MFFYSRKVQIILLICWCAGMAAVYADLAHRAVLLIGRETDAAQAARLQAVVAPPPAPAEPEAAPFPEETPADAPAVVSDVNVVTNVAFEPETGSRPPALSLEIRYALAGENADPPKVRSYYIAERPAVVLEMSGIWEPVEGFAPNSGMPQVTGMTFFAAPRHLRLVLQTQTLRQAQKARVSFTAGADAARARIQFPE